MWRETKHVRADDLPAVVILVQLIRLVIGQVVTSKVVAKNTKLWGMRETTTRDRLGALTAAMRLGSEN